MSNHYIHRYWTGAAPLPASSLVAGGIAGRLGDLIDWTDDTLPAEITEMLNAHSRNIPPAQLPKHRANIARLALLRQFGGVWIDHDFLLLSIPDRAEPWVASDGQFICSAAMFFRAGDPLLDKAINAVRPHSTCYEASGGGMLQRVWPDVRRVPLPYSLSGERDLRQRVWGIHLWGSKADG